MLVCRTLCQVVGFANLFLGQRASLTCVADPVVVACVVGFWKARGLAAYTIKLRVQHISQASHFVESNYCPKEDGWQGKKGLYPRLWFKNLSAAVLAEAQRSPQKLYSVELWEAWEFAREDYLRFVEEVQVGCLCCIRLSVQHSVVTCTSIKRIYVCPLLLQANSYNWSPTLARRCQTVVLRILLCGCYQPPIRAGALRLVQARSRQWDDCACEKCK